MSICVNSDDRNIVKKYKISPPPIPKKYCVKCGTLTDETQSVYGIMHMECYKSYQIMSELSEK